MSDLKKHGWKVLLIITLFGIVGRFEYEHEVAHEPISTTYYNELNQHYERLYAELRVQDINDRILRERYNHE